MRPTAPVLLVAVGILILGCTPAGRQAVAPDSGTAPGPDSGRPVVEASAAERLMAGPQPDWPLPPAGQAILYRGSLAGHGLPFLTGNSQLYLYGEYGFLRTAPVDTEARLEAALVWYLPSAVLLPEDYVAAACTVPGATGLSSIQDGRSITALRYPEYSLFISLSAALPEAEACRFIRRLAERFAYFYGYADGFSTLSFPASLQL